MFRAVFCLGVAALLAGCSSDYSPNNYDSSAVQRAAKVDQGVVVGRRVVDVTPSGATGAVAGAAAGGIAGSQVGSGVTQAFGALGGGLLGGAMGEAVEKTTGQTHAYEYIVREATNTLVSVTQQDKTPLVIGQKVLVISGNQARIVPDYTVAVDQAPPAPLTAARPAAAEARAIPSSSGGQKTLDPAADAATTTAKDATSIAAKSSASPSGSSSSETGGSGTSSANASSGTSSAGSSSSASGSGASGSAPSSTGAASAGTENTSGIPVVSKASTAKSSGSDPNPMSLVPSPAKLTPDQ